MKRVFLFLIIVTLILSLCSCVATDRASSASDVNSNYELSSNLSSKEESQISGKKLSFEYFDLVVPDSWEGKYVCKSSILDNSGKTAGVSLYEKGSYDRGYGGYLFSIIITPDPIEYRPRISYFGEIIIDKKYYLYETGPTDVQFDPEGMEVYNELQASIRSVINTISSDKYTIKIYHSNTKTPLYTAKTNAIPKQKITVKSNGSNAILTLTENDGKKWKETFSCKAKVGKEGVIDNVSEQTSGTPCGTYNILFAFGINNINTGLEYKTLTPDTVWINDVDSYYYNVIIKKSDIFETNCQYEDIYSQFASGMSSYGIAFDFNGNCESPGFLSEKNGGSVIFIDGKSGELTDTFGDIAIKTNDMETLLKKLDKDKNPIIEIK